MVRSQAEERARTIAGKVHKDMKELSEGLISLLFEVSPVGVYWEVTFTAYFDDHVDLSGIDERFAGIVAAHTIITAFYKVITIVRHVGERGDVEESIQRLGGRL
jgi:hypothetical protein